MKKNISRRSFVHQLSLATAAVMANPLDLYSCAPAAQKKLGVALVGLGGYSTGQLGASIERNKILSSDRSCYRISGERGKVGKRIWLPGKKYLQL